MFIIFHLSYKFIPKHNFIYYFKHLIINHRFLIHKFFNLITKNFFLHILISYLIYFTIHLNFKQFINLIFLQFFINYLIYFKLHF